MALTPKEKERIVEEETLRFETRQRLEGAAGGQGCHGHARHRCRVWCWALAVGFLLLFLGCPGRGWHDHRGWDNFRPVPDVPAAPERQDVKPAPAKP